MDVRTEETRMPSPQTGEQQSKSVQRCMSSNESQKSFPEQKQRVAFCHNQWKNKGKSSGAIFVYKDPRTSELFYFARKGVYRKNGRILTFVKKSRGEIMSDHILNRAAESHADDKAGYPPNCNNGYVAKNGKCLPVEENDAFMHDKDDGEKNGKDKDKDKEKNGKDKDKKKKKDNPFEKKKGKK